MKAIGTPNNVEILIHCHCCKTPHPRADAPAVKGCLDWFLEEGVIERERDSKENIFRTTPLGAAWLRAICNTEMPKTVFVDERGEFV